MQIQLDIPFESDLQEIDFQIKIEKRNKNFEEHKVRSLCSDYENETKHLWNSDPDRQGKEAYDSGEVDDLNKQYEREAVKRDVQKNCLFRVSTGKPVYWSDFEEKWVDSE